MRSITHIRGSMKGRVTPATVIACVALFFSLGGVASASVNRWGVTRTPVSLARGREMIIRYERSLSPYMPFLMTVDRCRYGRGRHHHAVVCRVSEMPIAPDGGWTRWLDRAKPNGRVCEITDPVANSGDNGPPPPGVIVNL